MAKNGYIFKYLKNSFTDTRD